jgi:hypothetical protein
MRLLSRRDGDTLYEQWSATRGSPRCMQKPHWLAPTHEDNAMTTTMHDAPAALVSNTILQQLGGWQFLSMTGAKNLVAHDNGLSFKLPHGFAKDGINYVRITLDRNDTYTMLFGVIRLRAAAMVNGEPSITPIRTETGFLCADLCATFTTHTGLDTRIPTVLIRRI